MIDVKFEKNIYVHAEKQVGVVLAVHRNEAIFPLQCCDTPRKAVLHIPKYTSPKVNWKDKEEIRLKKVYYNKRMIT